jgi:Bacterial sugar transferase
MSGFVVARRRYDSQIARRVSGWERYYLCITAPADVACAIWSLARAEFCTGSATSRASPQPGARLGRRPLDELPQLFDVPPGDMPPVGPRPALPDEAAKYVGHIRAGIGQRAVRRSGVYEQMPADRAVSTASQT